MLETRYPIVGFLLRYCEGFIAEWDHYSASLLKIRTMQKSFNMSRYNAGRISSFDGLQEVKSSSRQSCYLNDRFCNP